MAAQAAAVTGRLLGRVAPRQRVELGRAAGLCGAHDGGVAQVAGRGARGEDFSDVLGSTLVGGDWNMTG